MRKRVPRTVWSLVLPVLLIAAAVTAPSAIGAGGDTCSAPTVISSLPYNDTGDTTGAADNARITGCANFLSMEGPDHIYQFTVFAGSNLTFTVTPGNPKYDSSIYIRTGCLQTTGTCVASSDVGIEGESETISVSALTPGTYFFYVDSFWSGFKEGPGNGPYTLSVTGTLGIPNNASFYTVTPCRVLDTREPDGLWGGPALSAGMPRTFTVGGRCLIPSGAKSISANVTVTQPSAGGYLTVYAGGTPVPGTSTINFSAEQTRANNALVLLGGSGTVSVVSGQPAGNTVHFILDVNGYFQ